MYVTAAWTLVWIVVELFRIRAFLILLHITYMCLQEKKNQACLCSGSHDAYLLIDVSSSSSMFNKGDERHTQRVQRMKKLFLQKTLNKSPPWGKEKKYGNAEVMYNCRSPFNSPYIVNPELDKDKKKQKRELLLLFAHLSLCQLLMISFESGDCLHRRPASGWTISRWLTNFRSTTSLLP